MPECKLEYLFSFSFGLKLPPEVIGPVPEGIRANFYLAGGSVEGPRLKGKVLPVGADFLLLRKDGIGVLDVRATFETEDGALIYVAYSGTVDAGPDGYERFLADVGQYVLVLGAVEPLFVAGSLYHDWLQLIVQYGRELINQEGEERARVILHHPNYRLLDRWRDEAKQEFTPRLRPYQELFEYYHSRIKEVSRIDSQTLRYFDELYAAYLDLKTEVEELPETDPNVRLSEGVRVFQQRIDQKFERFTLLWKSLVVRMDKHVRDSENQLRELRLRQ